MSTNGFVLSPLRVASSVGFSRLLNVVLALVVVVLLAERRTSLPPFGQAATTPLHTANVAPPPRRANAVLPANHNVARTPAHELAASDSERTVLPLVDETHVRRLARLEQPLGTPERWPLPSFKSFAPPDAHGAPLERQASTDDDGRLLPSVSFLTRLNQSRLSTSSPFLGLSHTALRTLNATIARLSTPAPSVMGRPRVCFLSYRSGLFNNVLGIARAAAVAFFLNRTLLLPSKLDVGHIRSSLKLTQVMDISLFIAETGVDTVVYPPPDPCSTSMCSGSGANLLSNRGAQCIRLRGIDAFHGYMQQSTWFEALAVDKGRFHELAWLFLKLMRPSPVVHRALLAQPFRSAALPTLAVHERWLKGSCVRRHPEQLKSCAHLVCTPNDAHISAILSTLHRSTNDTTVLIASDHELPLSSIHLPYRLALPTKLPSSLMIMLDFWMMVTATWFAPNAASTVSSSASIIRQYVNVTLATAYCDRLASADSPTPQQQQSIGAK